MQHIEKYGYFFTTHSKKINFKIYFIYFYKFLTFKGQKIFLNLCTSIAPARHLWSRGDIYPTFSILNGGKIIFRKHDIFFKVIFEICFFQHFEVKISKTFELKVENHNLIYLVVDFITILENLKYLEQYDFFQIRGFWGSFCSHLK